MKNCNTEELYILHRQRLLNLINSKVEDVQKAEDLLHDSFIKFENCCAKGCVCEKPKAYLFRTALNTVFDYIKNRKRKSTNLKSNMSEIETEINPNLKVKKCDILECIAGFLNETSIDNKKAFNLVDLMQIPQVEVAKELGIPISTLKSRVQRTRKYLSEKIDTCCPDFKNECK